MSASSYETVVGLEVHCQLLTRTKIFCGCANRFGDAPNTNVCPVCLGLPGALPVLNREAVALAIRAALATGCTVQASSVFARKNYFYPDLPKGYQISQYDRPLAVDGSLDVETAAGPRAVRIQRIHMEEDAGKLVHDNLPWSGPWSGVDLNRAGVPLIEIVSHPDLRGGEEAHAYLSALRDILVYAGVSDCNMEEGSLRCDANVSIRRPGEALGTRTEVKNLNSFRHVARAIEHEAARQASVLAGGGVLEQETRLWDADRGETRTMRSKEDAHDYRYFPEPDLPPLLVSESWLGEVRSALPELPVARRHRFARQYALPAYDAGVLTQSREVGDYFEALSQASGQPKLASNWVMTELLRKMNEEHRAASEVPVSPAGLGELLRLVSGGTVGTKAAKEVFEEMWSTGRSAADIVRERGLEQVSEERPLRDAVRKLLDEHPSEVASYRRGKTSTLGWFVGQLMKSSGGKANPQVLNKLLREALDAGE